MPIHEQGYRRYAGTRAAHGRAWIVIAKTGIRARLRQRRFLGLLLISWVLFLVRTVQLYAAVNLPQAAFLAPTPELFRQFLGQQQIFVFLVTVYGGASAGDRCEVLTRDGRSFSPPRSWLTGAALQPSCSASSS